MLVVILSSNGGNVKQKQAENTGKIGQGPGT